MYHNRLEGIMIALERLKQNHTKRMLPERRALIETQYKTLIYEFEGQAVHGTYCETKENIDITITLKEVLTCDAGGKSLNNLIGLANFTEIKIVDDEIRFALCFQCWEWAEKRKEN